MYTEVVVSEYGSPAEVTLVADLPEYCKMICPDHFESPIVIEIQANIENYKMYGSFDNKEPGPRDYDIEVRGQKKLKLFSPDGAKKFTNVKTSEF